MFIHDILGCFCRQLQTAQKEAAQFKQELEQLKLSNSNHSSDAQRQLTAATSELTSVKVRFPGVARLNFQKFPKRIFCHIKHSACSWRLNITGFTRDWCTCYRWSFRCIQFEASPTGRVSWKAQLPSWLKLTGLIKRQQAE